MQLAGQEPLVLMNRPNHSSSNVVVSELLVEMLLWARGDAEAMIIERDTEADAGGVEAVCSAP